MGDEKKKKKRIWVMVSRNLGRVQSPSSKSISAANPISPHKAQREGPRGLGTGSPIKAEALGHQSGLCTVYGYRRCSLLNVPRSAQNHALRSVDGCVAHTVGYSHNSHNSLSLLREPRFALGIGQSCRAWRRQAQVPMN